MAQLFAILHSLDNPNSPQSDLHLPLSLQAPNKDQLDLSKCPHVYENGRYDMTIRLDLNDLEQELNRAAQLASEDKAKLQESSNSLLLGEQDKKRARLQMNKISDYIDLDSEEAEDEDSPFINDDDDSSTDDDLDSAADINAVASVYTGNVSSNSITRQTQAYSVRNAMGNYKRVVEVTMEINAQPKAAFIFDLAQPPHLVVGQAIFKETGANSNNQPFLLLYDVISLCFIVKFSDNQRIPLYSGFLLCANNNEEENENINQILLELTELDNDYILDLMFQNQQYQVERNDYNDYSDYNAHRSYKSLNSYVNLLELVLHCYKNNFASFKAIAKHVIVKDYAELPFNKVRTITHKSNHWLGQNLDVLMAVKPEVGVINYGRNSYLPLKMQSEINKKSFDTFENRVVVGFLKMVLYNATKIYNEYKDFVTAHKTNLDTNEDLLAQGQLIQAQQRAALERESDPYALSAPTATATAASAASPASALGDSAALPSLQADGSAFKLNTDSSYQAPIIKLKYAQLGLYQNALDKLQEAVSELNLVYLNYAKLFNLRDALLDCFPRKAKAFQELKPYAQVFQTIMSWFRYGDFSLEKDMLFLNVKTLDKIFEYYCLYRLLDMLVQNGFKPQDRNASYSFAYVVDDRMVDNDPFVANTYHLVRGKQKVTVYYQPIISNYRFDNGLYAYRTTKITKRTALNNNEFNFYCPDFILKFNSGETLPGDDDYLIFDAKFSQGRNIIAHYIDNLIQKYGMETSIAIFKRKSLNKQLAKPATPELDLDNESITSDSEYVSAVEARAEQKQQYTVGLGAMPRYQALPDDLDNLIPHEGYLYNSAGTIIQTSPEQNIIGGYEFVGCKVPKMIFALQGRVNQRSQTRRNRVNQSTNSATAFGPTQKQYQANGSYTYGVNNGQGGYAYYAPNPAQQEQTQPATPLVKDLRQQSKRAHGHIWFYHNSPLARKFPPNISVGMVEMNTQVNSTPDLWRENMSNLPYLQTHKDLGAKPTQST